MHKKCGSEVVIDHRDDQTFESDVKEQGDEEFYREQVIPLYSDLYRFLRAFVGDPEAAKDIAQITMERAWRKIHQLKKRDRVKSWLFQIGRNVSSTYYTCNQTKIICNDYDPDLTMGKLSDVEADVLEILLDKERSHLILKALNRINPKYKPVLQLWALGDLTQKEIAEVLDINYNVESIIKCRRNRYGFSCIIFLSEGRRKEVKTLNGYSYLTLEQRREIERMYAEGERVVDIAARLKRSAAAIYEELKRGYTGEFDGYARPKYSADLAQATVQENFRRRGNRRGANC